MQKSRRRSRFLADWLATACLVACCALVPARAEAQQEPISATGHGGFFDHKGRQIPVTLAFAQRTQRWYRDRLLAGLPAVQQREFQAYEKQLHAGLRTKGQERMVLEHEAIEWLLDAMPPGQAKLQAAAKLRALRHAMNLVLPAQGDLRDADKREAFVLRPELLERVESQQLKRRGGAVIRSATVNSGKPTSTSA